MGRYGGEDHPCPVAPAAGRASALGRGRAGRGRPHRGLRAPAAAVDGGHRGRRLPRPAGGVPDQPGPVRHGGGRAGAPGRPGGPAARPAAGPGGQRGRGRPGPAGPPAGPRRGRPLAAGPGGGGAVPLVRPPLAGQGRPRARAGPAGRAGRRHRPGRPVRQLGLRLVDRRLDGRPGRGPGRRRPVGPGRPRRPRPRARGGRPGAPAWPGCCRWPGSGRRCSCTPWSGRTSAGRRCSAAAPRRRCSCW